MWEIEQATAEDASLLAELCAKAFRETGFASVASEEKREELLVWLKQHCGAGKIWFMRDEAGPVTYAYYDPEKGEVVGIATRDGMEHKGNGSKMLEALCVKFPTLKVQPVSRGGKALAKKFGFSPSEDDECVWNRKRFDPAEE
jgi:hypothetical protein